MKLIIEDDEGHKTTVPFVREEITVGRQDGNTIKLTERNVSRKHARFFRQSSGIFVEDLSSYNGIRVNGDKIDGPVQLKEGDLVQIGDYDLAVQDEAGASPGAQANGRATVKVDALPEGLSDSTSRDVAGESNGAVKAASRAAMATAVIKQLDSPRNAPPPAPEAHEIAPGEAPHLVVVSSELAGREFACIRSVITIGRGEECDVHIDHRSLSREHARLQREDNGTWKVVDLGASNPLQINGEEYAESALKGGDVISLGHIKLRFVAPGEDYTYAPEGSGKKSPVPLIIGGVVLAGAAAAGIYFGVIRKPAQPVVPENPKELAAPKQDLVPKEEKGAKPEGTTAEAKPDAKPDERVAAADPGEKPAKPAPEAKAPEVKPDLKANPPDEVAIDPKPEAHQPEAAEAHPDKGHPGHPDKAHPAKPEKKNGKEVASAQPAPDEGEDPVKKALAIRTEAEALIQATRYEEAITKLRKAIALNPKDAIAHKYLGGCLINTGSPDEATTEYHKFIDLAPNHPEAARVRQMLNAYEKAKENSGK